MENQACNQSINPVHARRLSILGLTDHLVHQRVSAELYTTWYDEHKAWVSLILLFLSGRALGILSSTGVTYV